MNNFSLILLTFASAMIATPFQSVARQYISPDRSFELTIPPGYGVHTGVDKPPVSYIPICQNDSLVCITYPQGLFKGTTFGAASLQVTRLTSKTAQTCLDLKGTWEHRDFFDIDPKNPSRMIDGVKFLHSFVGAGAMSHDLAADLYRRYKNGRCYELSIRVTYTNFSVYPPGAIKEFTKRDQTRVKAQLLQIVDSFHFLL